MYMASLSISNNKCYLQQEPGAFRHECEGHHWADTGEGADNHEHTPTVKLVGGPHAEAPSWKRRRGEWGRAPLRLPAGKWGLHSHYSVRISSSLVRSLDPQKNELTWADQLNTTNLITTNSTTSGNRCTSSRAEKKAAWNQRGQSWVCWRTTKFWRQEKLTWDNIFPNRLLC